MDTEKPAKIAENIARMRVMREALQLENYMSTPRTIQIQVMQGNCLAKLLEDRPGEHTIMIAYVQDHTQFLSESHTHAQVEHIFQLEGTMTMNIDGVDHIVLPGQCVHIPRDTPHDPVLYEGNCAQLVTMIPSVDWFRNGKVSTNERF